MFQKTPRWSATESLEGTVPKRPLVSPSRSATIPSFSGLSENRCSSKSSLSSLNWILIFNLDVVKKHVCLFFWETQLKKILSVACQLNYISQLKSLEILSDGLHPCHLHYVMICCLLLFSETRKEKGPFTTQVTQWRDLLRNMTPPGKSILFFLLLTDLMNEWESEVAISQ